MLFERTAIHGVLKLRLEPHVDHRGFFARVYCPEEFARAGVAFQSTQINLSHNSEPLTLRGMHYQPEPYAEAKIVRCTRGRIFDVVVDLRPESPTYRQWCGAEIDAQSGAAMFIPEGCAHGFLTLTPDADVLYQMGRMYEPGHGRGVRWDDPALAIAWPGAPRVISDADQAWPLLA